MQSSLTSHNGLQQFNIMEYCQRIQQEFHSLEKMYKAAKSEITQLKDKRAEMQEQYQRTHTLANKMNLEYTKQFEMSNRLMEVIQSTLGHLPPQVQQQVKEHIDRAQQQVHSNYEDQMKKLSLASPSVSMVASAMTSPIMERRTATTTTSTSNYQREEAPSSFPTSSSSHSIKEVSSPESKEEEDEDEEDEEDLVEAVQKRPRTVGGGGLLGTTSSDTYMMLQHLHRPPSASQLSRDSSELHDSSYFLPIKSESDMEDDGGGSSRQKKPMKRSNSRGPTSSPVPGNSGSSNILSPSNSMLMMSSATTNGIPKTARLLSTLPHNEVVCTVAFNAAGSSVLTGGKGSIKVWDVRSVSSKPTAELKCFSDSYIRCNKFIDHERTLLVGGETNSVVVWDLEPTPRIKTRLNTSAACYALATHTDTPLFYTCCSDGTVGAWDLNSGKQVKTFAGHAGAVSCVDISPDGSKLLTGSLDTTVKVWDISSGKEIASYPFPAQIFSLAVCPGDSWVIIGLENNQIEVLNFINTECKYQLHMHDSCVLSLKWAHSGKWFASGGKDKTLNTWKSPFGGSLFQCREPNSILCCDISADDNLIVTGSGERLASIYEVVY